MQNENKDTLNNHKAMPMHKRERTNYNNAITLNKFIAMP